MHQTQNNLMSGTVMTIEITRLKIYPVKSLKGIALDQATLTPQGLLNDRRWMVVRSNGKFVTQRDLPRMALVHTSLDDLGVTLELEGHGKTSVPFLSTGGDPVQTKVWGVPCEARDEGEEVSRWLTSALKSQATLKLVRMAPGFVRPQGKSDQLGENTHTLFADAAPFLVASENSLQALNRELASRGHEQVPMNRFRPNIIVSGLEPFVEHKTGGLYAGAWRLKFCHPCERCVVTTINQATAEKDPGWQPFNTLKEINPVPGKKKPAPAFGQNAILETGDGVVISVGDRLEVF
jgi:uncharacterized protein YcbX